MVSSRIIARCARLQLFNSRTFTISARRFNINERGNDTVKEHRKLQTEKPLNPHMTNTTSTIANEMPSVGKDKAPPELLSSVDGDYIPTDGVPENTERMSGGTQKGEPQSGEGADLSVGEIEGGKFKIEPLRRTGEELDTTRARLLYQSRKRGTAESDLLMSTFADANLSSMSAAQLEQYDRFLDEDDWDIYYWATQEPSPTSMETAEGAGPSLATPAAQGKAPVAPASGEWAQTVGTFKPADRPVPQRWKGSEILALLRKHVKSRSAGGVVEVHPKVDGQGLSQSVSGTGGGGLGFMPRLKNDVRA